MCNEFMRIFLGGMLWVRIEKWSISSHVRVQINRELVIDNPGRFEQPFDQYYIPEDPEKIFTHDILMVSSKNVHFWRFRGFYKQNYLQ